MQHEVIFGDQPWGLGLSEKILPQYLKEKGYVTRAVGKWHLGHFKHQYLPEARGSVPPLLSNVNNCFCKFLK